MPFFCIHCRSEIDAAYKLMRPNVAAERGAHERFLREARPATRQADDVRSAARYTRAMLARDSQAQLAAAKNDFHAAPKLDRSLRLDEHAFSPKRVAFFEELRRQ